ncbi:hypothetical protein BVG16_11700 [Paenibacillus selenitireducens]|uniref:UPF0637 protein BVG16_11700 n=1 Tax=Paenibacillus selenitireducens TaxID=1324314 RepID=A0A1T2XFB3_9BACL|nr:DUF1054 domain-containing protein [Paenibacillus selenitireducens]OPA78525.1 hypothetical protein BVG16_11700 [Paenibacillus selenitireducens]
MTANTQIQFTGFLPQDFDVFTIPGLEARMSELIERVRPKLTELGTQLAPHLSVLCGEEMFPHVAKHARRTINPPNDTWVAWANNKRGYKAHPHFQVGMFESHLFIIFAVIYESDNKKIFAKHLDEHLKEVRKTIPAHFFWSLDHMKPEGTLHSEMDQEAFRTIIQKLEKVQKSEVLCGLRIERDDPILANGDQLLATIEQTFEQLLPLYKLAF